jgi:predicted Zn-dependent peptidase
LRIERIPDPRVREEIYRAVLPNGLPVLVDRKHGFRRKFAVLAAHYGSADCSFRDGDTDVVDLPDGIAHFLEHKLFERKEGDAGDIFARQGASSNAATSFRTTHFHFSCTERFEENLKTLLGFVGEPYLTEKAVEKERGIITQEIGMCQDDPGFQLFHNLLNALYVKHPVRLDICGTVDSIAKIDREILFRCFDSFYHPRNMVLIASGDLDPGRTMEAARDASEGWRAVRREPGEPVREDEPDRVAQKSVTTTMDVSRPKVALGFKDDPLRDSGRELLRRQIHTNMALDLMLGPAASTFSKLYEKGIIDDTFGFSYSGEPDFGFTVVGCDTTKPEAFRKAMLATFERFREEGFSNEDVNRARRKALGHYLRALNSTENAALALMWSHFKGVLLSDYMSEVQRVTRHDLLKRVEEHLVPERCAVSIVSKNGSK